jgi:hypothetical protein
MSALIPLIVVWLLVLVPSAVRSRAERRREFIGSFHRQLGALEASSNSSVVPETPATPFGHGAAARPPTAVRRRTAAERRRTILGGLLLSMVVTLLPLFVFPGKLALAVHLTVDNCFLVYVGLLVRWRDALSSATGTRVLRATAATPFGHGGGAAGGDPSPGLATIG